MEEDIDCLLHSSQGNGLARIDSTLRAFFAYFEYEQHCAAHAAALWQGAPTLSRHMENVNALKRISIPNAASYTSFKNVQTLRGCGLIDVQCRQQ